MNKKGVFLPLFVFVTIFILLTLLFIINSEENKKNDLVGLRAISIIKTYDEIEKINIYFELATKYAEKNTLKVLAENGGYSEESCEKTKSDLLNKETFILLETCPHFIEGDLFDLKPEQEFNKQLKKEIKNFIN